MSHLELQNVSVAFPQPGGGMFTAVDGFELKVSQGEFITLVGPSGCGKSTLLSIIDGLLKPATGQVSVGGKPVTGPGADRALVFQEFALLPWRTAYGNVQLGLELQRKHSPEEMAKLVRHYLAMVGLTDFQHFLPHQLSGGMRQRIGIARALAVNPDILLMDEPFAALDAQTREIMSAELLRIWEQDKKTVIFVTHGIDEAVYLADRIVVMSGRPGRVLEVIDVDLPRPRSLEIKDTAKFVQMRRHIWDLLEKEVKQSVGSGWSTA